MSPAMTVFRSRAAGRARGGAGRSLRRTRRASGRARALAWAGRRAAGTRASTRSCSMPPTRSAPAARTACARPPRRPGTPSARWPRQSLIPGEHGGKVVLIGPRPDAGQFAEAARSALENLARTLSIEWARHRVTATMIAPGPRTTDDQLAELVCYPDLARRRLSQRLPVLAGLASPDARSQPCAHVVEHLLALGLIEDLVVQARIGPGRDFRRSDALAPASRSLRADTAHPRCRT